MFQDQLIHVVREDQEFLIRIEIVALLTALYDQNIHDNVYFMNVYDCMKNIMVMEKKQQVKIAVMNFWMKVVDVVLRKQGMIDGAFPEVTFSKELKRIITFNTQKIKSCLSQALIELSDTGCLAAFVYVLKHETDDEVYKVAETHLDKLINQLIKYRMGSHDFDEVNFNSPAICTSPSSSIFNGILSPAASVDLNSLNVEELLVSDCSMTNAEFHFPRENINRISPDEFLHFVYSEIDHCRNRHNKESKSWDSDTLLESILEE